MTDSRDAIADRTRRWWWQAAVLMDVAFENRIDTDPDELFLVDSSPVGDDLVDLELAEIAKASEARNTRNWVRHTAEQAHRIRTRVLERLVEQGILRRSAERPPALDRTDVSYQTVL